MRVCTWILVVYIIFNSFNGKAQSFHEYNNKLSIKSGVNYFNLRDRVISSFNYKGSGVPVMLNYLSVGPKSRLNLSFEYIHSLDIKTDILEDFSYSGSLGNFIEDTIPYNTISSNFLVANIKYVQEVKEINDKLKLFVGGNVSWTNFPKHFINLYYYNTLLERIYSLHGRVNLEYSPSSKHLFAYSFSLPLLSYVDRTLYHINTSYSSSLAAEDRILNRKFASLNSFIGFNSELEYNFKITNRLVLELHYAFSYFQYKYPRKVQLGRNNLLMGLAYNF